MTWEWASTRELPGIHFLRRELWKGAQQDKGMEMHVNRMHGCSCSKLELLFLHRSWRTQVPRQHSQAPLAHKYSWLAILIVSDGSHLLLLGSLAHPQSFVCYWFSNDRRPEEAVAHCPMELSWHCDCTLSIYTPLYINCSTQQWSDTRWSFTEKMYATII